ncbi:hypothetical protein H4Q26_005430 [Puccinia striiformis f. sp. tritici PST-130]|nr:hypothetical protein H4Q26_005430 [Puccinia striiformis f. sp. tritici PST-130]
MLPLSMIDTSRGNIVNPSTRKNHRYTIRSTTKFFKELTRRSLLRHPPQDFSVIFRHSFPSHLNLSGLKLELPHSNLVHQRLHRLPTPLKSNLRRSHKHSSEVDSPKPSLPSSVPSRQGSLNLAPGNRVPCTPSPLSGCFGNSRRTPQTSPQAQRALNVSKKELTEVIELLQQVPQNDLSQTRALLSLMVAILSDTPKSRECMRDNAGFLTLITVLASLGAADIPEPQSAVKIVDEFQSVTAAQRRVPSIALCDDDELLCPTDSSKLDSKSPQSRYLELREERDAVATLVFKCFALALSNHHWPYPHYRRQKIEKLFGILFAFIVADFSSVDLFLPSESTGSSSGQGTSSTPIIPPKLDSDSKYSKMVELLRKTICDHSQFLRVEIADAVLLLFALHADLFQQVDSNLPNLEDNTELHFLSLKAIEILAATSRHSQIALNSIELTAVLLERLAPQPSPNSSPKKAQPDEPSMNTLPSADRQCRQVVKAIIHQMLQVGTSPREARMLFRQAVRRHEAGSNGKEALDEDYLELILSGMQSSNCPPFIHFGSPKGGCAYATLDSLGANAFPPIQTSGWSFVTWIQIESFGKDPNMLLELLTISDPDEECYVQIAISYFSSIIIQTARPSGSRTIAEFNKVILETGRFYHFAVVQNLQPELRARLLVFLLTGNVLSNTAASSPYGRMTPQLSLERPRWNLAGCWLFNRALLDDMLFVMSTLAPKSLPVFKTLLVPFKPPKSKPTLDQATSRSTPPPSAPAPAALLNKSPLIKAVKEPASAFIPQTSIYFALSAKNGIIIPERPKQEHDQDDNIHSMSYMQQIYTPIDPPSFDHKANDKTTLASGPTSSAFGPIFANGILNASTPNSKASHYFMDPVDTSEYGLSPPPMTPSSSRESTGGTTHDQVLELIGDVKLCSPRRLDDSIWTASGSIFLVRLIQLSSTERQLMMALQIFFEAINHNWRLSEDAEKFRSKAHLITPPVHRVLLCFAGIMVDDSPNQLPLSSDQLYKLSLNEHIPASKLENKHPTKACDIRLCGMIETSIWSRFSMKRISKMNLLPKMLHALRNRQFSVSSEGGKVIPAYIRLLGCVLKAQFNAQIIRHLASYLTASLTPEQSSKHELRVGETKPDESKDDQEPQSTLSKLNVPVSDLKSLSTSITLDEPILVLKVLHDLLLSPNDQESCSYITQFLKAINGSKWLLMFFRKDTHPEIDPNSRLSMATTLQEHLSWFYDLRSVLAKFCFINETVLVTTLSLLSQVDIRTVPMFSTTRSSDPPGTSPLMFKDDLQGVVRSIRGIPNELVTPEMLPIIIALLKPAYNGIARRWMERNAWDKDVVKVWANYVLILSCVPHQESLQHMQETPGDGTKSDMIPSSPEASCLSSFPLTSNLLGPVKLPDHMEEYRQFHHQLLDMIVHPLTPATRRTKNE